MNESRTDVIKGLYRLADLLTAHDEIALPHGVGGEHIRIYGHDDAYEQALALAGAMDRPTVEILNRNIVWLSVSGYLSGLSVVMMLPADRVCERKISGVHRATDGSIHEVTEWAVPAELSAACDRSAPAEVSA